MSQFYEVCHELGAEIYVVTTRPPLFNRKKLGAVLIENWPAPNHDKLGGIRYHFAVVSWFLRLVPGLLRFIPDVVVLTAFQNHWFLLSFLSWMGVAIIPAVHNGFWSKIGPTKASLRLLLSLNSASILKQVKVGIAVSDNAAEQLRSLIRSPTSVMTFNATYPRSEFSNMSPADIESAPPFKVLFVGRLEANKGVYDLLHIAERLNEVRKGDFHFDVCGDGAELQNLRDQAKALEIERVFVCHGWCNAERIRLFLEQTHVVVIPTTAAFIEGFPKVYAEAILAARPVVLLLSA